MLSLILTVVPLLVTFTIAAFSPAEEETQYDGE
jgi:hypothetical protein